MGKKVDQINPATGEVITSVESHDVSIVPEVVAKARSAQKIWREKSFKERGKHVLKVRKFLAENRDRAVATISQSNGKTHQDALVTEVMPCILGCEWYAKQAGSVLRKRAIKSGSIAFANKSNTMTYEPVGVVGIISPWNYPFSIPFGEVIMGLMAGNAIVLKVAANCALIGLFIEECIKAGEFPDGLFTHLMISGAEIGPALLAGGVNKIFFTGSVSVGKQLMREAADTLTPLSLELGGKDPMIVLHDASIERAVNCACWAGFQNAGQSCAAVERVYVDRRIYDEFLRQLIAKTKALRHGPETGEYKVDIGAITTKGQLDTITRQVVEAVKAGATIAAQSTPVGDCSKGWFYPATVLTGCTPDMAVMRDETFGPVLPIVPFDTEEEAIAMANNSNLALTASVFSNSGKHSRAVAAKVDGGVVSLNDHLYSHGMAEAPWGGWKETGIGRTHGAFGLKEMCNAKCINEEKAPICCIPRNLWWFPFSEATYKLMDGTVSFVAPRSICDWFSGLKALCCGCTFMFKKWKVEKD